MGQRNTTKSSVKTTPKTDNQEAGPREEQTSVYKISVRNLVEFILRSGDIMTSSGGLRDADAMQEGTKIHQWLQKQGGSHYRAEVSLSTDFFITATPHSRKSVLTPDTPDTPDNSDTHGTSSAFSAPGTSDISGNQDIQDHLGKKTSHTYPEHNSAHPPEISDPLRFQITLEGRADGIFTDKTGIFIDEIKGVYKDIRSMKEPVPIHFAQALCYAYMYAKKEHLNTIGIRMTYCHIPTKKVRYFSEQKTFSELEQWFSSLLYEYMKWCIWQLDHRKRRDHSIKEQDFPFSYRPGQKNLVTSVYLSILRKKRLYIEAPTGVGKTISTIFPAVKSMGEHLTEKIFYLTAKTITKSVAEETFSFLTDNGLHLKCVSITAKEKICPLEISACHPETCERAKGHFDRINDAMFDILTREQNMDRECVTCYAQKHQVCPFEFSLDLAAWADVITCDYNYVFDPAASLKRFFATETENNFVLLIDEAHNLVDRAREMYSASLVKEEFLTIKNMINTKSKKLSTALEKCSRAMLELKRLCDDVHIYRQLELDTLLLRLMRLNTLLETVLQNMDEPYHTEEQILFAPLAKNEKEALLDFYFKILEFLNVYELLNDQYTIYGEFGTREEFILHLQCMDPSKNLDSYLKKVRSSIFFSATLLPIHYYKEQLAFRKEDYAIYAPSPFSPENRLIMIGRGVSTKYSLRSPEMYQKISDYILTFLSGKTGNYLVFFPSYQMMETIFESLQTALSAHKTAKNTEIRFYLQNNSMSEEEREKFLMHFEEHPKNTTVGLCVMGGIFGEGIDLKQERLIGTVLVGTGLPMVCAENELFRNYFDQKQKNGFSYAYQFPGMNKVLQAAGRVIRTTDDRGAILLLDDRFFQPDYQELFPKEWFPFEAVTIKTMGEKLARFWASDTISTEP